MKSLFAVVLLLFIVSCNGQGTNTGNPDKDADGSMPNSELLNPVDKIVSTLCTRIQTCYPSANVTTCTLQIPSLVGFTDELNFNPPYTNLSELKTDYSNGAVTVNDTALTSCLGSISQLACSNSLMTTAYSTSQPTNFATLFYLFRASTQCLSVR